MNKMNTLSKTMKNLKEGQKITFKVDEYGTTEIFTRKIHTIYKCSYADHMHYNTRGRNGEYGCNGFAVSPEQILKVHN